MLRHDRSPAAAAEQPKPRDYLSFSAVATFQACPLKFFFRYVAGLAEKTISTSLAFGSAMHAALQWHFEQLLAADKPPSHDTLLEVFWDDWHVHDHQTMAGLLGGGVLPLRVFGVPRRKKKPRL